jgi:hypothetical protein
MAKHIDRERLYTDALYRFQYVAGVAKFGEEDIRLIKASAPILAPLVPAIVDAVYERLFEYDIMKAHFLPKMEGFEGKLEANLENLNVQSEAIHFRKGFLGNYLKKLVTGEYDEKFVKYLDWVGRIHTDTPEKASKIKVDYIHVNALFAWLHGFLVETLDQHAALQADPTARAKTLAAFSKLLWIQNDMFAKYYVKDGAEFAGRAAEKAAADKAAADKAAADKAAADKAAAEKAAAAAEKAATV